MTTFTIIVQNAPYQAGNKAWHALRFAGALLVEDVEVRMHLLDKGVELGRSGHEVPQGMADLEALLKELMECGMEVNACGMTLGDCGLEEGDLIPGIRKGSMKSLASWAKTSDNVLTF